VFLFFCVCQNNSSALLLKKTTRVLCFIVIDKASFLEVALGNNVQQDMLTSIRAIIDTWGKRCTYMVMVGNVPDIKVDSIPFNAVKTDNAGSWKAFAQVLTQVIYLLFRSLLVSNVLVNITAVKLTC